MRNIVKAGKPMEEWRLHCYSPRFGWREVRLHGANDTEIADRKERFLDADSALMRRRVFDRGQDVNGRKPRASLGAAAF